ncbi:MAG: MOSC N-terminal beta barrel domain-containing protein [Acetobacteraceae bacterium]
MRIEQCHRHPGKSLSAKALHEATVQPGGALPRDRAFALAQGDAPFDPADPTWLYRL